MKKFKLYALVGLWTILKNGQSSYFWLSIITLPLTLPFVAIAHTLDLLYPGMFNPVGEFYEQQYVNLKDDES